VELEIKHLTSAMDGMHELTVGSREEFGFECVGIFLPLKLMLKDSALAWLWEIGRFG